MHLIYVRYRRPLQRYLTRGLGAMHSPDPGPFVSIHRAGACS